MRRKHVLVAVVLILAAIAAGAVFALRHKGAPAAPAAGTPPPAEMPSEISLPAHLRAQTVTAVPAPAQGTLEGPLVEPGEQVYEGQVLGRIQNTTTDAEQQAAVTEMERAQTRASQAESQMIIARADVSRARSEALRVQAQYDKALRTFERQQMLFKEGATPRLTYEKAARELDETKAERDTTAQLARGAEDRLEGASKSADAVRKLVQDASAALDHAREAAAAAEIHSPVSGMVIARSKRAGDEVTADTPDLFQIAADLTALEAVLDPPATELARIRAGQEALIAVADLPDPIPAQVSEVRGAQVLIRFTSPGPALRPGSLVQVRLRLR